MDILLGVYFCNRVWAAMQNVDDGMAPTVIYDAGKFCRGMLLSLNINEWTAVRRPGSGR